MRDFLRKSNVWPTIILLFATIVAPVALMWSAAVGRVKILLILLPISVVWMLYFSKKFGDWLYGEDQL